MLEPRNASFAMAVLLTCAFIETSAFAAAPDQYSARNPPPASFIFAGPVGGMLDKAGDGTVYFRFVAVIHSLDATRIQVVDTDAGTVLVDDAHPLLQETPYKHPSKPDVRIFQWEGRTPAQTITASEPAWLHDGKETAVNLEIRVFKGKKMTFSFKQPASYSAAVKEQILHAVEYNKSK
jgi:hypothetical protein